MIDIVKMVSTEKTTYLANRKIQYIVIHYTAGHTSAKGAARANARWYAEKSNKEPASADFFVDDAEIVQYNGNIKNRYAWAVGGKKLKNSKGGGLNGVCRNSNSISIEICSRNSAGKITYPNDKNYSFTEQAIANALELTKYLMEKYGIDEEHVVRHYDVTGKLCPGVAGWNAESGSEIAWAAFKSRLIGWKGEEDDMDVSKLTDQQCYQILEKAQRYLANMPLPTTWNSAEQLAEARGMGLTDGARPMALATRLESALMAAKSVKKATEDKK